jgi:hypothetical protein
VSSLRALVSLKRSDDIVSLFFLGLFIAVLWNLTDQNVSSRVSNAVRPGRLYSLQILVVPSISKTASRMAWVEESLKRFEVVLVSLKGTEFQILSASFEICDARYVERHFRRERSGEFFLSGRGHENINTKSFLI